MSNVHRHAIAIVCFTCAIAFLNNISKAQSVSEMPQPKTFWISSGNTFGGYCIQWNGKKLVYQRFNGNKSVQRRSVSPRPEQWLGFWRDVERIGVWQWKKSYKFDERSGTISDPPQWKLHIIHGERELDSEGEGAFPKDKSFQAFEGLAAKLLAIKNVYTGTSDTGEHQR